MGLSYEAAWNRVVGHTRQGDTDTIARWAHLFKVPEVNLRRLVGFDPLRILPPYPLEEAEAIFQTLTDEEEEYWMWFGERLIRTRTPGPATKEDG